MWVISGLREVSFSLRVFLFFETFPFSLRPVIVRGHLRHSRDATVNEVLVFL